MKRIFRLWMVGVLPGVAACFSSGTSSGPVSSRAAYDMQCPEKELQVTDLGGKTYGVKGCGKQATYTEICMPKPGSFHGDCSWSQGASAAK